MTYSPWQAVGAMPDIVVEFADLDEDLGWWDPERRVIVLDRRQSQRQRRCTLAHELEHIARGDEYIGHVSPVLAVRQEIAASVEAARKLVPLDQLVDALLWSQDEYELAENLHVDVDTIQIRLLTLSSLEHTVIDKRIREAEGRIA